MAALESSGEKRRLAAAAAAASNQSAAAKKESNQRRKCIVPAWRGISSAMAAAAKQRQCESWRQPAASEMKYRKRHGVISAAIENQQAAVKSRTAAS